ncbi:MAG: radical SAM protein, partial [Candidatus Neomarinimicrobiota bacterium]
QPLVFAILAGLTPPGVEIELYDERRETIDTDINVDLVAITVETHSAARAYQISNKFKQKNIPVIMGGYHPTFMPEEAAEYADSIVIGEAEEIWPDIIADAQSGNLKKIYCQKNQSSLEKLPIDRSVFKRKKYASIFPVQVSRGCKYFCDFCSINAFYGNSIRQRPIKDVVNEIKELRKNNIFFIDDNIFTTKNHAKKLFQNLIPLKVNWVCQISIDIAKNHELLDLMAKSGCVAVVIGFESLDIRNLNQMKKGWNIHKQKYDSLIFEIKKRGIMIYATFVFGYDYDTVESFEHVINFAIKHKFLLANFNPLTPMPETELYKRLEKEDRLLFKKWWIDPKYSYGKAIFRPLRMTPEQLTNGCFRARYIFNRYRSIASRAIDFRTNCRSPLRLALYLHSNFITRREIFRKQGRVFGLNIQNGN